MPSEKRKKPKLTESYKADYQGATPQQVAQAMLKYRPVQAETPPTDKAKPNPVRLTRHRHIS